MIQRTGPESLINMGKSTRSGDLGIKLTAVSTFVAGCDVTARNGGTHVIPGKYRVAFRTLS